MAMVSTSFRQLLPQSPLLPQLSSPLPLPRKVAFLVFPVAAPRSRLPSPLLHSRIRSSSPKKETASPPAVMESPSPETVPPAVIIGSGRLGTALERMGGGRDVIVRRGEKVPPGTSGPIIVCTRNADMDAVLEATPTERWQDLVFVQNGMLEPWLNSKGLGDATQVLVYFAVSKLGEAPIDGKTDLNPEGLTAASGKWAPAIASRLHSAGLSCKVLDEKEFQKPLLEKLIWISAFMLVGACHPGSSVGEVVVKYREEVSSLIKELALAASNEKGINFGLDVEDRLCAYALSVAHFPTAVKEFEWRNGWFYSISQKAVAEGKSDPCPLHTGMLKKVGAV